MIGHLWRPEAFLFGLVREMWTFEIVPCSNFRKLKADAHTCLFCLAVQSYKTTPCWVLTAAAKLLKTAQGSLFSIWKGYRKSSHPFNCSPKLEALLEVDDTLHTITNSPTMVLKRHNNRVVWRDECCVSYCIYHILQENTTAYSISPQKNHELNIFCLEGESVCIFLSPWTKCLCTWLCRVWWWAPGPGPSRPSSPALYIWNTERCCVPRWLSIAVFLLLAWIKLGTLHPTARDAYLHPARSTCL